MDLVGLHSYQMERWEHRKNRMAFDRNLQTMEHHIVGMEFQTVHLEEHHIEMKERFRNHLRIRCRFQIRLGMLGGMSLMEVLQMGILAVEELKNTNI